MDTPCVGARGCERGLVPGIGGHAWPQCGAPCPMRDPTPAAVPGLSPSVRRWEAPGPREGGCTPPGPAAAPTPIGCSPGGGWDGLGAAAGAPQLPGTDRGWRSGGAGLGSCCGNGEKTHGLSCASPSAASCRGRGGGPRGPGDCGDGQQPPLCFIRSASSLRLRDSRALVGPT